MRRAVSHKYTDINFDFELGDRPEKTRMCRYLLAPLSNE